MQKEANVTVVIPCFNCGDTIERAVASVYNQTLRPSELILVDDKSKDQTLSRLYALQRHYPEGWIKVIALELNAGPSGARNAGWEVASCQYVALLDSDDVWHPQKIEIQYSWMKENPEVVLSGHEIKILGDAELFKGDWESLVSHANYRGVKINTALFSKARLLLRGNFSTSSVMLQRAISHRFAEGKYYGEDRLLLLEIACAGGLIYKLLLPLEYKFKETYGVGGLSASVWRMEKGEIGAFHKVWKAGHISFGVFGLVCIWSLAKYIRRLALAKFRKRQL